MTNDVDTVCKWGLTKGWTHFLKAEKKNHIEILAFSDEVQTVKLNNRLRGCWVWRAAAARMLSFDPTGFNPSEKNPKTSP